MFVERWRFIIHGNVDGYSRLILFMTVSDNTRSQTVLDGFLTGVRKYGLPSRVR